MLRTLLVVSAALLLAGDGLAQTFDGPRLDSEAVTPLHGDQPPGERVEKLAAVVDWQGARTMLSEMRKRDAAYERQLQALRSTQEISPAALLELRPKGIRPGSTRSFKKVSLDETRKTRVPLLLPLNSETARDARVFARDNAYAATGELPGGAGWELLGTRMRLIGGSEETIKMRTIARRTAVRSLAAIDAPFVLSRHDEGVEMAFYKFNVSYQLSVFCADPETDERCAHDEFITTLIENLVLVNEQQGEAQ